MKKYGLLLTILLVLVLGFSVCAQDKKTIIIWDQFFPEAQSRFMDSVIAEFEEMNPEIQVERSVMDTESIRKVLKVSLTADAGPDIFYYDSGPDFWVFWLKLD